MLQRGRLCMHQTPCAGGAPHPCKASQPHGLALTRTLILLESRAGLPARCNLSGIRLGRAHDWHGATTRYTDQDSCTRACTSREAQTGGGGAIVTSCPCAMFATSSLQAAMIWLMPLPRHSSRCHHCHQIRCSGCQLSRVVLCRQQRAAKAKQTLISRGRTWLSRCTPRAPLKGGEGIRTKIQDRGPNAAAAGTCGTCQVSLSTHHEKPLLSWTASRVLVKPCKPLPNMKQTPLLSSPYFISSGANKKPSS